MLAMSSMACMVVFVKGILKFCTGVMLARPLQLLCSDLAFCT